MTPPELKTAEQKQDPEVRPANLNGVPLFGRKKTAQQASAPVVPFPTSAAAPVPPPVILPTPLPTRAPVNEFGQEEEVAPESPLDKLLSPRLAHALDTVRTALKATLDARMIANLKREEATLEIHGAVEQICLHHNLSLSPTEVKEIGQVLSDEILGLGPIESLIARDDISEIMVNGPNTVYIEIKGVVEKSGVKFRDDDQLLTVCQRIANSVGRRVDEGSPICDARLADGSRVNIILPPLALDGAALTIRKFKRDKLTIEKLVDFGSVSPLGAELIKIIAACRANVIVSGGTGSGKTTMLNCLTRYIRPRERIVTCEDSAELQLQQPHVVRLETRPANLEGVGEISMRDLVRNCLRMRPERIIVGEVRGPEAFDLLQAMNTGHDGSMGTVHANNPREAISRLENMIAMNQLAISPTRVREQIAAAINVIVQVQRLRDGSRKVVNITEITGMEGEVVSLQDLLVYEITGEDEKGMLIGRHKPTGLRPRFYERLREFGLEQAFNNLMGPYFISK